MLKHNLETLSSLSNLDKERMLSILRKQFAGVSKKDFYRDLEEKDHVMTLRTSEGIAGFSTFMNFPLIVNENRVRIIFSGDTAVLPSARYSSGFIIESGKYFLQTAMKYPNEMTFWILISKGPNTYKFLPFYFNIYYPMKTPPLQQRDVKIDLKEIADVFGTYKYPLKYDERSGIILTNGKGQRLRPKAAEAKVKPDRDLFTEFFFNKNPYWLSGNELVCVAPINMDNLSKNFKKILHDNGVIMDEI